MTTRARRWLALLGVVVASCGRVGFEPATTRDAGSRDAGPRDATVGEDPDVGPRDASPPAADAEVPDGGPLDAGPPVGATRIGSGLTHSCAVRTDGSLYCWGMNVDGELGRGSTGASDPSPAPVADVGVSWRAVEAGANHTCAIATDDTLWCWGSNTYGQLGLGTMGDGARTIPTRVGTESDWISLDAGVNHTCARRSFGSLYCWGFTRIALGIGDGLDHFAPAEVPGSWVAVATGSNFTCAIDGENHLWCWGVNDRGQLGLGPDSPDSAATPQRVLLPSADTIWFSVGAGFYHACGAVDGGNTLCWGANNLAQLGVGDRVDRLAPTEVPSTATINRVAGGVGSSFGITAAGTLLVWGEEPDAAVFVAPEFVGGPSGCVDLASGQNHQCAICVLDRVWCRGRSSGVGPGGGTTEWRYLAL